MTSQGQFQTLKDLLIKDRSYRRFDASKKVEMDTLIELISITRYVHSGRNLQPLKYRLVNSKEESDAVFPLLKWAGYYTDWDGPEEAERPVAYIIQCLDKTLADGVICDDGLQLEAISLGCVAKGMGGCIIKVFDKRKLSEVLGIPGHLDILTVYALGYPAEKAVIVPMDKDGDYKYFRDKDVQCVPKRPIGELIIESEK